MEIPYPFILISIIIPVYNREKQLVKTLQSVINQDIDNTFIINKNSFSVELILIDNGSQDGSLAVCETFRDIHSNDFFQIKVLSESKKGANAARNKGIANASGDYILFFDSDDIMYADFLSTISRHLVQNNYPQAIAYPSLLLFPNGKIRRRPHYYSKDPADQLFEILILTHSVCIKKTALANIGLWNEEIERWQDLEFGFRVLQNTDNLVWITGKPLYEVFYHMDSISGNSYTKDYKILYASLMNIKLSIDKQPDGAVKDRQLRALSFKICSIAAQLRKEGNLTLGKEYLKKALLNLPKSRKTRATGFLFFQFFYEGNGGRGIWRIARKIL